MDIYLAKTQGFCAGVAFAIDIVDQALEKYGAPLYVYHDIVHNTYVVEGFKRKGVTFVEDVEDVPVGSRIIFSAHGVPPQVVEKAKERKLRFVDATCPLVTKVHNEATKFSEERKQTVFIGHRGHQEMIGTTGYIAEDLLHVVEDDKDIEKITINPDDKVAVITQTTLSVDETTDLIDKLKDKFPQVEAPPRSDLCYATQNRQDAVKELAKMVDIIIICGSPNSSNSNRLRETGERAGCESHIIDMAEEFDLSILEGKEKVGISSGASVPRVIVEQLVERIMEKFPNSNVHSFKNPEKNIVFKLPDVESALE